MPSLPSPFLPSLLLPSPLLLLLGMTGCQAPPAEDDDATAATDDDSSAGDDDSSWMPDLVCPGDPSGICDEGGKDSLEAGAGAMSITPTLWESWNDVNGNSSYSRNDGDSWNDCGTDRLCPASCSYQDGTSVTYEETPGYSGPDADGSECDQTFQGVWMAGFSNGRAMNGVHDDVWARAVVLQQGNVLTAWVSLDLVGFFKNSIDSVRVRAREELGLDWVSISATHNHEGPDTMGIWGKDIITSGVDPAYMATVEEAILQALADGVASLRTVHATFASHEIQDDEAFGKGVNNFNIDSRDPGVHDKHVNVIRFFAPESDQTVATVLNFANHPEALGGDNLLITSDFADSLRRAVEEGVDTPDGHQEGVGGVAVFINGTVGGLATPLHCDTSTLFNEVRSEDSFEKSDAIGSFIGWYALSALGSEQAITEESPALSFRTSELYLDVENWTYQLAFNAGLFPREAYNYNPDEPVSDDNMGQLLTEVGFMSLGPARIFNAPGELLPEWFLGGYDGSLSGPLRKLIEADNPNPPDLSQAPPGPYLMDLMGGEMPMVFGLTGDELGYIIPPFQYELGDPPYFSEAEGDHYEETNSLGPSSAPLILDRAETLITWTPSP